MIKTTRDASGNLSTESQAMPAPAAPLSGWLVDMINRRGRESAAPAPAPASGGLFPRAAPRYSPEAPSRMPNMGANGDEGDGRGPMPRFKPTATRMRRVYTPLGIPSLIPESAYKDQQEYQLEDGSWSLDGLHGTLEGSQRLASEAALNMPTIQNPFPGLSKISGAGGGTWGLSPDQYKKTFGGRG